MMHPDLTFDGLLGTFHLQRRRGRGRSAADCAFPYAKEREFFHAAVAWCVEEFGEPDYARWSWSPRDTDAFTQFVPKIWFRDPNDALLFKLRWV